MSETGFTTGGFFRRTQAQIFNDFLTAGSGVFEEMNLGPGSMLFQLQTVIGLREKQIELMLEQMVSGMTIDLAQDIFVEKLALEKGIRKKGPQKAGGYVRITTTGIDPSDSPIDLLGTVYESADGKKFYRAETGVSEKVYSYIPIVRGTLTFDGLPDPYTYISETGYLNSNKWGSGSDYSGIFNEESQIINWAGVSTAPPTGDTYYVGISGATIRLKDDISAEVAGTGYNIGANTIKSWSNNTTLDANTTVNNPEDITGGADWENTEELRDRVKDTMNEKYSYNSIRKSAESIQGVRAVNVYQADGIDRTSISGSWAAEIDNYTTGHRITGNYSGAAGEGDYVSGNMFGQRFSPGSVLGLSKVRFRMKRVGFPPPLVVGFRQITDALYDKSGIIDTYDLSPPATTYQDVDVDIDSYDLESTDTYILDFWCSEKSGAVGASWWASNYWEIATGFTSGNLGGSSHPAGASYTGMLYLGSASTGSNMMFKTYYPTIITKIDVAVKDGYNYEDIEAEIEDQLDNVDAGGHMPVGVNYSINQATPVSIYYSTTAYLEDYAKLAATVDRIDNNIELYVERLDPGENVVYSQIYKNIINDPKIWRIDDLQIWESGGSHSSGQDIHIGESEVAIFGGSTVSKG